MLLSDCVIFIIYPFAIQTDLHGGSGVNGVDVGDVDPGGGLAVGGHEAEFRHFSQHWKDPLSASTTASTMQNEPFWTPSRTRRAPSSNIGAGKTYSTSRNSKLAFLNFALKRSSLFSFATKTFSRYALYLARWKEIA